MALEAANASDGVNLKTTVGSINRNSVRLYWDWVPQPGPLMAAIDDLYQEFLDFEPTRKRERSRKSTAGLKETLARLVAELWVCHERAATWWIAYPRGSDSYQAGSRYRPSCVTLNRLREVTDFLSGAGYATSVVSQSYGGFEIGEAEGDKPMLSRLRATPQLTRWLSTYDLDLDQCVLFSPNETIVMREAPKKTKGGKRWVDVDYVDDAEAVRRRAQLSRWNEAVATRRVLAAGDPNHKRGRHCKLRRLHNGAWDLGGRYYGGWWQQLSKDDRLQITIDGEAVVELDYGSLHPRLCYQLEGIPLAADFDPYDVQGVPKDHRWVLKILFMQLLNIKGNQRPQIPDDAKGIYKTTESYQLTVRAMEALHAPIKGFFRKGPSSLRLQAIDSDMAEFVMERFSRLGKVVLPVHDSFIVAASDEVLLRQTMTDAYIEVLWRLLPSATIADPIIRKEVPVGKGRAGALDDPLAPGTRDGDAVRWAALTPTLARQVMAEVPAWIVSEVSQCGGRHMPVVTFGR